MKYIQPYGLPDYGTGEGQPYVNGDPTIGREGSIPPAEAIEYPQREIVALIKNTGFQPSNEDLEQVSRGVRQQLNYAVATFVPGSPNDLAITLDPPLDEYKAGLVVRIKSPVANTGPSSLNINELGARSIRRSNNAVTAPNDIQAGMVVNLVYDGSVFQIINFQGFTTDITNNNTYIVDIPYVEDIGTTNHIIAPFSPAITSAPAGKFILVKVANTNTYDVDIVVNALPVKQVWRCNLTPLVPGDIIPGMIIALVYDGVRWQMISMTAQQPRIMTGPMSLYVNAATGHDTNYDGRSATVSGTTGPFRTIGRARDEMLKWTNWNFTFRIYVANGTYEEKLYFPEINGSGECELIGNDATPSGVLVWDNVGSLTNTACFDFRGRHYILHGFKVISNAGTGIAVLSGGQLDYWNIEFGFCGMHHLAVMGSEATEASWRVPTKDAKIIISGSSPRHISSYAGNWGVAWYPQDRPDLIFTTSVAFSDAFIKLEGGATAGPGWRTIQNANLVTGKKFDIKENSIISSEGRGESYLPGTVAGTKSTGAQYT